MTEDGKTKARERALRDALASIKADAVSIPAKLEELTSRLDQAQQEARLKPHERIRMIRDAGAIMFAADLVAADMCEQANGATMLEREALLGEADEMWEAHSRASDLIVVLIIGDAAAIAQMNAIEAHCTGEGI